MRSGLFVFEPTEQIEQIKPRPRLALLGVAIASGGVLAMLAPSGALASKPVDDRGVATSGWNFKLDHRSSPTVLATGRLNYYSSGDKGCFKAFATGQLKTVMGDVSGRNAHLWVIGEDCHHPGHWVRLEDSTSPTAGTSIPFSGKVIANVRNASVWVCSEDEALCTVPEPGCPTCGGKPRGNPNAAKAAEKKREDYRKQLRQCAVRGACPKYPKLPELPEHR